MDRFDIGMVPLWINYNNFGDSETFPLVPSSGQNLNLSSTLVYDQILAKLSLSCSFV